jgi:hypothetical protein
MANEATTAPTTTDERFGDFTVAVAHKPVGGVTEGQIPDALAALLAEHVASLVTNTKAIADAKDGETVKPVFDADRELVLTARDEKAAKLLSSYATAWGRRQEPKLYIHKVPNGKRYGPEVARLAVELDEEVGPDNRPGRKASK